MRIFSTPKTSPELVRHAQMLEEHQEKSAESMPVHMPEHSGQTGNQTPPRSHSPSLVRGVSTLGRKFSRRFEKFGESETARKLRMASPSRKYQFSTSQNAMNPPNAIEEAKNGQKSVSRVDSFRNFFQLSTANLKTPRAVKRRSRNTEKHRSASQGKLNTTVDAATLTVENALKKKAFHRNHFGSELTLPDYEENTVLSECQSEADLRGYLTTEDEADDRSVVSDFPSKSATRFRSSSGNLAARLGILPENRTILDFKEAGNVFSTSHGLQIKTYGLIDENREKREESPRKISHGQESGYGSDGATTNSSRASPRGSLEGDSCTQNSVREKIQAFQNRENETPSPPTMTKEKPLKNPPLLMPKPLSKSVVIPPKKPARAKKPSSSMIDVVVAEEDEVEENPRKSVISVKKEYKMIRLVKEDEKSNELGIIIAKKKLPDLQPPVTGFQVVHIEPRGLIDR